MKDCQRWMWIHQRLLRYALMKDIVVVDIFGKYVEEVIQLIWLCTLHIMMKDIIFT